ncbi:MULTISPECIES: hypothetical protein [Streptomyces]|uniref:hypothetical protein n=1 Tax=Streptomyces TaxID=1883 RepID=UPI0004C69EC2|nr:MULTISPECIES: hypothetical protein [Streptomyces]WSF77472.1 hypothetical protein OG838_15495 [Streptomyces globisporus]WSQ92593.1 hypothetical protein OG425_14830 [Streptomyces globisporus]GGW14657.1 hypothetical protein GCM10010264_59690 [Streptomyces globisporus]
MRNKSAFLAAATGAILLNVLLLANPAAADGGNERDLPWTAPPARPVELVLDPALDVVAPLSGEVDGDLPWTR